MASVAATSAAAIARSRLMRDRKHSSVAVKGPIDACHHVAIVVRDAAAAREFYGELLGLDELERPADVAGRFAGAWYQIGAIELHVFEQPDYQPPSVPIGPH